MIPGKYVRVFQKSNFFLSSISITYKCRFFQKAALGRLFVLGYSQESPRIRRAFCTFGVAKQQIHMPNLSKNCIGKRYGQLVVLKYLGKQNYTRPRVQAKCDCGIIKDYFLCNLQRKSHTHSCGCFRRQKAVARFVTHGLRRHPLYRIWADIKTRCYNKNALHYPRYGGRGVKMCSDWKKNPDHFIVWAVANGWRKGLKIDKDIKKPGNLTYGPK